MTDKPTGVFLGKWKPPNSQSRVVLRGMEVSGGYMRSASFITHSVLSQRASSA